MPQRSDADCAPPTTRPSLANQRSAMPTWPQREPARANAVTVERSPGRTPGSDGAIAKAASGPVPAAAPSIRAEARPVRAIRTSRVKAAPRAGRIRQRAGRGSPRSSRTACSKPLLNPSDSPSEKIVRTAAAAGFASPETRKRPKRYSRPLPLRPGSSGGIASGAKSERTHGAIGGKPSRRVTFASDRR